MPPRRDSSGSENVPAANLEEIQRAIERQDRRFAQQLEAQNERDQMMTQRLEVQNQRDEAVTQQLEAHNRMFAELLVRLNAPPLPYPAPPAQEERHENPPPVLVDPPEVLNFQLPDVVPPVSEPVYERFRKQMPPVFDGNTDPATAERWLKKIQQICNYMQPTDAERVACAINQLEDEARGWWEIVVSYEDVHTMTWVHFLNLFHEKYLGEANLSNKVREFMSLRQGSMPVAEYTAKFDALARFAPFLVPSDQARKMKYMHGLNVNIVSHVDSGDAGPRTYANAVQRALRVAGWHVAEQARPAPRPTASAPAGAADPSQESSRKRFKFQPRWQPRPQQGYGAKTQQGSSNRPQANSGNRSQTVNQNKNRGNNRNPGSFNRQFQSTGFNSAPMCRKCGRTHTGECPGRPLVCYRCGREGHMARVCPTPESNLPAQKEQPKANARVFSIREDEVRAGTSTAVTGQISVDSFSAYALIDSGATNSFIASRKSDQLCKDRETFSYPFVTATPSRDRYQ